MRYLFSLKSYYELIGCQVLKTKFLVERNPFSMFSYPKSQRFDLVRENDLWQKKCFVLSNSPSVEIETAASVFSSVSETTCKGFRNMPQNSSICLSTIGDLFSCGKMCCL